MDLEKHVNQEENQDELHFILLLLILLIRQSSSEGNPSDLRRQLVFAKELGVPAFGSSSVEWKYSSKRHRKRGSD